MSSESHTRGRVVPGHGPQDRLSPSPIQALPLSFHAPSPRNRWVHTPGVRLELRAWVPIPPLLSRSEPQFSHLQNWGNISHCGTRPSFPLSLRGFFYRLTTVPTMPAKPTAGKEHQAGCSICASKGSAGKAGLLHSHGNTLWLSGCRDCPI